MPDYSVHHPLVLLADDKQVTIQNKQSDMTQRAQLHSKEQCAVTKDLLRPLQFHGLQHILSCVWSNDISFFLVLFSSSYFGTHGNELHPMLDADLWYCIYNIGHLQFVWNLVQVELIV